MLVLLPPSEGKARPRRGGSLDLQSLHTPALTSARTAVLDALIEVCDGPPESAREALGLPQSLDDLIVHNAHLREAVTAPAARVYTGVLFSCLDLPSLTGVDLRRANSRLVVFFALFGMVRPTDRICAYRLSASVSLPPLGPLTSLWRTHLPVAMAEAAGRGLVVDMRSSPYAGMWSAPQGESERVTSVKVWQRGGGGQRTAVSHHNKASKGHLARLLATAPSAPRDARELADLVREAGWDVELDVSGRSPRLDVYLQP